ncbi:1-aminocyclopropane-1-carboxylate deaminase [gamma proteobacterium IMCC2047]|nr:1-aminocyclopropane-1-carboxylate deaminase [gamma proteobacterium IMCC2047]
MTFMRWWQQQAAIELDPVYTGKMMMGLCELLKRDYFPAGSKIVAVHTGGMQGVRGMQRQMERMLT